MARKQQPASLKKSSRKQTGRKKASSRKKVAASNRKKTSRDTPAGRLAEKTQALQEPAPDFIDELYARLIQEFGQPDTPLHYKQPYELAIAVILSAQCTDEQVNKVTPPLFAEFTQLSDFYTRPLARLETLIYSTGFYKNKAKNIREFARLLDQEHQGQLPRTIAELTALPGIGRKTANVVLNEYFGIAEGIVVDTHVARIMRLFGFTSKKDAVQIERDLIRQVPRRYWRFWSLLIIFLGRKYCGARKQLCADCCVREICPAPQAQLTSS